VIKAYPTTSFNNINNSRKTLLLSVKHLNLQNQKHTNTLILKYLFQPENSVALISPRGEASNSDTELLLTIITEIKPPTQIILNIRAQILELNNLEIVKNN